MRWRGTFRYALTDIDFLPERESFPVLPTRDQEAALAEAVERWLADNFAALAGEGNVAMEVDSPRRPATAGA